MSPLNSKSTSPIKMPLWNESLFFFLVFLRAENILSVIILKNSIRAQIFQVSNYCIWHLSLIHLCLCCICVRAVACTGPVYELVYEGLNLIQVRLLVTGYHNDTFSTMYMFLSISRTSWFCCLLCRICNSLNYLRGFFNP